jgi:hypothetical protein
LLATYGFSVAESPTSAKPPEPWTWPGLAGVVRSTRRPARPCPDQFLLGERVQPYTEMPLWVPASLGDLNMPIGRTLGAGLRRRSVNRLCPTARLIAAIRARHDCLAVDCKVPGLDGCAAAPIAGSRTVESS